MDPFELLYCMSIWTPCIGHRVEGQSLGSQAELGDCHCSFEAALPGLFDKLFSAAKIQYYCKQIPTHGSNYVGLIPVCDRMQVE